MINTKNIDLENIPLKKFLDFYNKAIDLDQQHIEACCISTINTNKESAHSRFVNIKYILSTDFIFFTNYQSNKSIEIQMSPKIALNFFWSSINTQIRIEGIAKKLKKSLSDDHFRHRNIKKNALSISSKQSKIINSYDYVIENYENQLKKVSELHVRPDYWGGYSVRPHYFEFWEGHDSRINKRNVYKLNNNKWNNVFLQP